MNPYEVLQVATDAKLETIKAAYRKLSAEHHPDKEGGDRSRFEEVKLAFDVLSDFGRRDRYDKMGRTDESPATPQRIQAFLDTTMNTVVNSTRQDGSSDDPVFENIKDKMILSVKASRVPLKNQRYKLDRLLERTTRMLERFKPREKFDPVGNALRREKERLQDEIRTAEDAMELSIEAEKVLNTYDYEVGPGPEGHFSPGPTRRSRGPLFLTAGRATPPA